MHRAYFFSEADLRIEVRSPEGYFDFSCFAVFFEEREERVVHIV